MQRIQRKFMMTVLLVLFCLMMGSNAFAANKTLQLDGNWHDQEIKTAGEADTYTVNVPQDSLITFTIQGLSIGYINDCLLYDNNMLVQYHSTSSIGKSSETSPKTKEITRAVSKGIYKFVVQSSSSYYGSYRIKASVMPANNGENEPNNDFAHATTLPFNTNLIGFISAMDTIDFYTFNIPTKQNIEIKYAGMTNGIRYTLYDANWREIDYWSTYYDSEATPGTGTYKLSANAGGYYLKVTPTSNYYSNYGRYQLRLSGAVCEHTYRVGSTVSATYLTGGYTNYKCTVCGATYKGNFTSRKKLSKVGVRGIARSGKKKFRITWNTVNSADGYQIRYSRSKKFAGKVKKKTVSGYWTTGLTSSKLTRKKKYYVQVRAYKNVGTHRVYGAWSKKKSIKLK